MSRRSALLSSLVVVLAACSGGAPAATTAPAAATTAPATTTTAPAGTTAPTATTAPATPASTPDATPAQTAGGAGTVRVTLTGGPDAGTYSANADPNCSLGIVGEGIWGVQYSTAEGGEKDFSSLQMVLKPEGAEDEGMFAGVRFLTTVTIGPLLEGGRQYEIQVSTREGETKGQGDAQVDDRGSTATITITGTTADGVEIAATVECPSVFRNEG